MSVAKENITYPTKPSYDWHMPANASFKIRHDELEEICKVCDSVKDGQIKKLKEENQQLKKLASFYKKQLQELELRHVLDERAIPLQEAVQSFTATPDGRAAWNAAWTEQQQEWAQLLNQGKISRIKYHRLIQGIDQAALAQKLGTAQPNISRIERRGYNVPTKTLKKLSEILHVSIEELIDE